MKKWLKYSIAFLAVGTLLAGCGQEKTNESSKKADAPKIEQKIAMNKIREYLVQVQQTLMANECFRSLIVYYDVDPV